MLKQLTSCLTAITIASTASAGAIYGFSNITNNNAGDAAIGEAQLRVELIDTGANSVAFYFTNAGPSASSMVQLYWEDSLNLLSSLNGWATTTPSKATPDYGVDFSGGSANPAHLPGSSPFIDDFSIEAKSQGGKSKNGVGTSEDVSVFFTYTGAYAALLEAIDNGDLIVGTHVQAFASGGSESFVSVAKGSQPDTPDNPDTPDDPEQPETPDDPEKPDTPTGIPSPTAALAGLGLLGLMASRRRRG